MSRLTFIEAEGDLRSRRTTGAEPLAVPFPSLGVGSREFLSSVSAKDARLALRWSGTDEDCRPVAR